MSGLNALRGQVYDNTSRGQYYRDNLLGLSAYERHNKFVSDYLKFYGGTSQDNTTKVQQTDYSLLKDTYRFIRSAEDDAGDAWEVRLARHYYDRLFKEYCIADLSRYKESKLGLRWRIKPEVISGKGQFICGAKGCEEKDGLCSYEVNFGYVEAGEKKQALVKLRLCPGCAYKLNYKKEKQYQKAQAKALSGAKRSRPSASDFFGSEDASEDAKSSKAARGEGTDAEDEQHGSILPPPAKQQQQQQLPAEQQSVLPADDSLWEHRPVQEVSAEEDFEQYFEGMFM